MEREMFFCSTSNVAFTSEEELRAHYKSAWYVDGGMDE